MRGFVENAKFVIGYSYLLFDFRFATKKQIELAKSPGERAMDGWLTKCFDEQKASRSVVVSYGVPANPDLWGEGATTLKASNDALHRCEQYCVSCDVHTWKVCDRTKRRYLRRTFAVKKKADIANEPNTYAVSCFTIR